MNIAIITACPSGVANSILAAGLLDQAATKLGWNAKIECQSSIIEPNLLTDADIEQAEAIIIAANTPVDTSRFVGKKVYQAEIGAVAKDAEAFLQTAVESASVLEQATTVSAPAESTASSVKKIVAITACPTGVAHTFMAAEALDEEGKRRGHQIKVETRGSVGAKNQLTAQEIEEADLVIIAADIEVPLDRFNGKKMYRTKTGPALKKTAEEMDKAFEQATVYQHSGSSSESATEEKKGVYKHLMTGVSHMLPVVVAGGLIIALSFVFGIEAFKEEGTMAAALMNIGGGSAFALMIPVLAGFIAFSIADRPGLAPGLVGGMLASSIGSGFLGGIAAGFIAGYSAKLLADKVSLPQSMEALKPILIIPFVATLFTGLVMIYIVGGPVAGIMNGLTEFLNNMGSDRAVLLGIILGAMMCFDLGGPVNKAAYAFGVGLLASQTYAPMAAIMAAGMVPALGMGLATFLAKNKFEESEREAGKASFVLGLCFISEGAIPFAAKDPMRVIPACMAGGALTGALSMLFGAKLMAPHGGLFVLLIPNAITPVLMYLVAIAAGTAVTGFTYAFLKNKAEAKQEVTA
ncbi:PTS fructose transporter subunit IIBC [Vibrio natriegens]|jgi:PTS system fructose-specific IIC component|uniref:protein-N(pi)-phosphohistidine--D-fructose phosphotransferase n=1 Tax=Vibrio natriegens NBRC 15636 = ATCC 14048 = DSM 759 TaxID=1219067 RepID=A0AAN0Y5F2_VIBNA|nr:PTS fructose transporter subunit IIBC [Vibrio natriegens]CAH0527650.1 PTS system fructose-specific EIIB'BC component [Catenococcus thiocycli]ALR18393.1 PTS fructose transporter subunit IIBC [Vibrio natriegens NBRC 15636 = ATCC 14048 = DSM 759]ANQ14340.1 PTS fructose transporter subunit IIBC [Vibrio natriegens NBRC 15636 = ATCC 14048 = DSM 759]ANQ29107.1 PTS fructose transporter subunit IIBC [Vibrio natriegens]EPM40383.1 PTS fructose transporter subunit IIBC [Vibrio natriegens NBRC 15636 = A